MRPFLRDVAMAGTGIAVFCALSWLALELKPDIPLFTPEMFGAGAILTGLTALILFLATSIGEES